MFAVSAPWLGDYLTRFTSLLCGTNEIKEWWVMHHFQVKRSKAKVTQIVWSFYCVCLSPCANLIDSLHMWHIRWGCVLHYFQVNKVQSQRSHRSFISKMLTFGSKGVPQLLDPLIYLLRNCLLIFICWSLCTFFCCLCWNVNCRFGHWHDHWWLIDGHVN